MIESELKLAIGVGPSVKRSETESWQRCETLSGAEEEEKKPLESLKVSNMASCFLSTSHKKLFTGASLFSALCGRSVATGCDGSQAQKLLEQCQQKLSESVTDVDVVPGAAGPVRQP